MHGKLFPASDQENMVARKLYCFLFKQDRKGMSFLSIRFCKPLKCMNYKTPGHLIPNHMNFLNPQVHFLNHCQHAHVQMHMNMLTCELVKMLAMVLLFLQHI